MHVTFLQCNIPPKIPTSDEALWFRMQVVDMPSQFLLEKEKVPESEEEQWENLIFPADPNFDEKIPMFAPIMLWKIFKNFSEGTNERVSIPIEVSSNTESYRASNDFYKEFVLENMLKEPKCKGKVKSGDEKWFISLPVLLEEFSDWYRKNCSKGSIHRNDFKRDMSRTLCTPLVKNGWQGWRLRQNSQDEKLLSKEERQRRDEEKRRPLKELANKFPFKKKEMYGKYLKKKFFINIIF